MEGLRAPVLIRSAAEAGGMPKADEIGSTFEANARLKAVALHAELPPSYWVLADDSGLMVDALGGAPGVYSARYAGGGGDEANNLRLLRDLARVPDAERTARFVCTLVLLTEEGEKVFHGQCEGRILRGARGDGGFGYDPLFVPEGYTETFAQLGEDIKNRISHRARALLALTNWLHDQGV